MSTSNNEMMGLIQDHEVLRAQIQMMIDSLNKLSAQPVQIKELLWRYRLNLMDFQETIRQHVEADQRIFKAFLSDTLAQDIADVHAQIQKQVSDVLTLVNDAVEKELSMEELKQLSLTVTEAIDKIGKLIKAHMEREDGILLQMQKDT